MPSEILPSVSPYRQPQYWRRLLLYTLANMGLALAGRLLAGVDASIAALWLPAGLDFAVLWHFGLHYWPGALLGPLLNSLLTGRDVLTAIGLATATMSASLLAFAIARVLLGRESPYATPRHAVLFAAVVATLPYAIGAGLGMLVLSVLGNPPADMLAAFRAWLLSDIAGMLMLAPLLLALFQPSSGQPRGPAQTWEREVLVAVTLLVCVVVFGGRAIYDGDPAVGYLLFPPVMWAALRMGPRETFFTVFAINLASVIGLSLWYPSAGAERSYILLNVQVANIALAITAMLLVSAMHALRVSLAAQQHAQDLFRGAIEYAASGVALISPGGRVLLVNRALSDMLGYPSHEMVGKQYVEIVHPDERAASLKTIARMTSGEIPHFQARKRFVRQDGEVIWVLITVTLMRAEDGSPLHFIGHVQNIDQFKRIEEALTESEARFRSLAESAPIGIYQLDLQGNALYANSRWSAMSGYSFEESKGLAWLKTLHPDDREPARAHFRAARDKHTGAAFEFRFVQPSGQIVWCMTRISPLFDRNGELRGYVGSNEDISERRLAEQELARFSTTMAALAAEVPQGALQPFLGKLLGGVAKALNARWASVSLLMPNGKRVQTQGYYADGKLVENVEYELPGSPCEQVISGEALFIEDAAASRYPDDLMLNELGVRSYLGMPLLGADGKPFGLVNVMHDQPMPRSESKLSLLRVFAARLSAEIERERSLRQLAELSAQLEQKVAQRTEQLAATNRELESFTWSVSHDMRAPLRTIDGFVSALAEDEAGRLSEQGKAHLARIRGGVARLNELINAFLQLSRLSSGELRKSRIDLSSLCQEIATELAAAQPERRVACNIAEGMFVDADPNQLRILMTNLLGNAWKFTGRVEHPQIRVFSRQENGETVFHVQDNGAGFDMADVGKLFTPFQRLHAQSEYEGSGIGLATCRRIVQRHGGRLWVDAKPGQGATFSFTVAPASQ